MWIFALHVQIYFSTCFKLVDYSYSCHWNKRSNIASINQTYFAWLPQLRLQLLNEIDFWLIKQQKPVTSANSKVGITELNQTFYYITETKRTDDSNTCEMPFHTRKTWNSLNVVGFMNKGSGINCTMAASMFDRTCNGSN